MFVLACTSDVPIGSWLLHGFFPGLLGQRISVTHPRRTVRHSLGPRDPKRIGRYLSSNPWKGLLNRCFHYREMFVNVLKGFKPVWYMLTACFSQKNFLTSHFTPRLGSWRLGMRWRWTSSFRNQRRRPTKAMKKTTAMKMPVKENQRSLKIKHVIGQLDFEQ